MSVANTPSASPAPSPLVLERSFVLATAITAIVMGVIALLWPSVTLLTVALLFGAYLIVTGIFRLVLAITSSTLSTGPRLLVGFLGVLVLVAGVLALANPAQSLVVLALVIGIGWIVDGIAAIIGGFTGRTALPRWLAIVTGVVSVLGGFVIFFVPGVAIATFVLIGGWILIAIGATTLLSLPPKPRA
ncbi:MAG: HdeD family acid-resistance protein [Microcella sp.]